VLEQVGLWSKVQNLGGLDAELAFESGLSHGERQLFCLARIMLDVTPVVILDEFTSK
jgi:ABC-type multidrug transport system fused ATPase/permease subunit